MRFLLIVPLLALLALSLHLNAQDNKTVEETKGLAVGAIAPNFEVLAPLSGEKFELYQALGSGPVVLVFYRGQWCPYCNRHLAAFQDSIELLKAKGMQVVAISPELPEQMEKSKQKAKAEFLLLHDKAHRVAEAYDVLFKPSEKTLTRYAKHNILLKEGYTDQSERLPVPATYLIGKDKTILYRHFEHDYSKRSTVKALLGAIK